jgi:hypothetical protein
MSEDPMDVIMDSAALTRERLDHIRETGIRVKSTPFSRRGRTYSRKCEHGNAALRCELCERDRRLDDLERLCRRQSGLLNGIAVALRGEPVEGIEWSHHDLVERAEDLVKEVEMLRRTKTASNSAPWSPPGVTRRTTAQGSWISRLNRTLDQKLG